MRRVVPTESYEAVENKGTIRREEGEGQRINLATGEREWGGLQDLGDVDVVVERPVGGAVVILAAVIVQAGHRSSCASSPDRMRPPAAVSCFDLLSSCQLPESGLLATPPGVGARI